MIDRLEQMEQRYDELSTQLGLPEVITDHEKYQKAGRALRELEAPVMKFRELKQVRQGLAEARAMLADPDMKAMATGKLKGLTEGKGNPLGNLGGLFGKKKPGQ